LSRSEESASQAKAPVAPARHSATGDEQGAHVTSSRGAVPSSK